MIIRNLDANGDWEWGAGVENYLRNEDAINLNIETSIKSWVGDCFWALQFGINWKALLSVGQQKALDSALQTLILSSYGVMGLTAASAVFNPADRNLTATYTIDTVYSKNVTNTLSVLPGVQG
jgi:hypothetical protein